MKKINFILLVAILGMLTSCGVGVYYPYAHNVFGAQTTVHLDKANFRVVRDVEAVVEVKNTNLSRSSVEKSAYGQLLRNARLTGSQVLINVVIEEVQRASGGLFRWALGAPKIAQYVAARATIIEFLDENGNPTISEPYKNISSLSSSQESQNKQETNTTTTQKDVNKSAVTKTTPTKSPAKPKTTTETKQTETATKPTTTATAPKTTPATVPTTTSSSKSNVTYTYRNKTQQLEFLASTHDVITRSHMGQKVYRKYLTLYQQYITNNELVQEFSSIQEVVLNYLQNHTPKELDKALNEAHTYDEILSVFKHFAK
jgi:hypothetical protein